MEKDKTLWAARRIATARRRRSMMIAAASLLAVNAGLVAMMSSGPIGTYRVFLAPEAEACGRAFPVEAAEAERILKQVETVAERPPAKSAAGAAGESGKERGDAGALAAVSIP